MTSVVDLQHAQVGGIKLYKETPQCGRRPPWLARFAETVLTIFPESVPRHSGSIKDAIDIDVKTIPSQSLAGISLCPRIIQENLLKMAASALNNASYNSILSDPASEKVAADGTGE